MYMYWVTPYSKFWSILFFAFRFNFNMSQDPDSIQSPEQVSDFDADAWSARSRRLKSGQPPVARARGPRLKIELPENRTEFFSRNFCMVATVRF